MDIFKHLNKEEITFLCGKIDMPQEAAELAMGTIHSYDYSKVQPYFDLLFDVRTGDKAVEKLNELFKDEPLNQNGFLWLTVSLSAALCTMENYQRMGIPDAIFYDTMACLSRFVKEHKQSYGVYGYDRQFWTYRQLSQALYRLGQLEFEVMTYSRENNLVVDGDVAVKKGDIVLSVHIPSDARIDKEHNHQSYKMAKEFFARFYPELKYQYFWCETWLLSPNLKDVLSKTSNILQFQSDYSVCNFFSEEDGYKQWVFKNHKLEPTDFPEDTSLQRSIKKYVLDGGKIGEAECIIKA